MLAGGIAGALAFAALLFAGLLLYQRLSGISTGISTGILAGVGLVFGAAGLYAGWIAATMVFAALRGGGDA